MILNANISSIQQIEERIAPLRKRLTAHRLYSEIKTEAQLCKFMESHVFAVWDFMSLLKSLQAQLTCVTIPWTPTRWPASRRFINEIVLGEESDQYQGLAISHFELYVQAMDECGADTAPIRSFLQQVANSSLDIALQGVAKPSARRFMQQTFELIRAGSLPAIAAAFTFGREDIIPDLFRQLVRDLNAQVPGKLGKFIWYLERHIEVDGEDHGPLSLRMVDDLCGTDGQLWEDAANAAEAALRARLDLWDDILAEL